MGYGFNKKLGCWEAWASARHPANGRQINTRRRVKTEAAAKKMERQIIREIEEKVRAQMIPSWAKLVDLYLQSCKERGLALKTIYGVEKTLKAATLKIWGDRLVDSISTDEIRDLVCVDHAYLSESSQRALLKVIRLTFEFAVETAVVSRNPSPKIKFKLGQKLKTVLTYAQAKFLLNKAKELDWEWYPHVFVALYTGMRSGELFAFRWDKVDFEVARIRVDSNWNNKDGFKETKSGDDRNVDIAPELVVFLKQLKLTTGSSGFVLPRLARWTKGEQARELRMFLNAVGIPPVRFHDLRATWATLMLSRGVEPVRVMSMGGWRSMDTMMRYVREAGIDIRGISHVLKIHDPCERTGQLFEMRRVVNSCEVLSE
ncbi:MAG: site-specific integrase [Deltaproteobacteria bacterium]|nr:site-specific integrase [Deltaproteobacteria bacterium]